MKKFTSNFPKLRSISTNEETKNHQLKNQNLLHPIQTQKPNLTSSNDDKVIYSTSTNEEETDENEIKKKRVEIGKL